MEKKEVTLELHNNSRMDKEVLQRAVEIAQKSTASMGIFDEKTQGEGKIARKPTFIPENTEERKKIETRIANKVIKKSEAVIDANRAANQMISEQQQNKKQKKS